MDPAIMINDLIYVYCISDSPLGIASSLKSKRLKSIKFNDLYVIVKYVTESEFSEANFKINLSNVQWVENNVKEHLNVIGMIMEYTEVIPLKFGTIYHTKAGLQKFITDYSASLIENIHNIRGKEEWAVKIYCDRKMLGEQIDQLSDVVVDLEKCIMASSPGKAFLLERKKNDLIDNEIDRLCKDYGQKYLDEFKSMSESISLCNLLPKEYTGRSDTMILNAAFLVSKNKVSDFKWSIEMLVKKDRNSGFFIEATGPWPPFNFVDFTLKQKSNET
ncbi:MAG: GvpL/GvpF family gas vesicle protein [Bacteroidales bacterium]|nr:GvpL/GvpF family gas vesicle protein [Bacteroidales bacterium]